MHRYIIDNFSQDQKYLKALDKIELRLADLKISGERSKTSISKDVTTLAKEAIKNKVDTLVVVGEDQSFYQAVSAVLKSDTPTVVGFIPMVKGFYAHRFGIPVRAEACEVISKRSIARIRACKVNHFLFLFKSDFFSPQGENGFLRFKKKSQKCHFAHIQYDQKFKIHGDFNRISLYNSDVMRYITGDEPMSHSLFLRAGGSLKNADRTHVRAQTFKISFEDKKGVILDNLLEIKAKEFIFDSLENFSNIIVGPTVE